MDITIQPRNLQGEISVIPSKSQAHRLLICAAFAKQQTNLVCPECSLDIEATVDCLNALGANIRRTDDGYMINPIVATPPAATLDCRESGSTLRFLLPIAGALGIDTTFRMSGRLPQRPLSPLWEEMERKGCKLWRPTADTLRCTGKLQAGTYIINGSVSSQFITGLLFALSLLDHDSMIRISGTLESKPYVEMTQQAMKMFGVNTEGFHIQGGQSYRSPGQQTVEGDWSNGAFWLTANALGSKIAVSNLEPGSLQGDRAIVDLLQQLDAGFSTISASDIPALVPILAVAAAGKGGAVFIGIRRLRLKESDRVAATEAMLQALGGKAEATVDTLTVHPSRLSGGTVDSMNDHRIAMSAAIAATVCTGPVTVIGADCVKKSYPKFWEEYARLGGNYEFHLR